MAGVSFLKPRTPVRSPVGPVIAHPAPHRWAGPAAARILSNQSAVSRRVVARTTEVGAEMVARGVSAACCGDAGCVLSFLRIFGLGLSKRAENNRQSEQWRESYISV